MMYFLIEYSIVSIKYFPPIQIKSLEQTNSLQEPQGTEERNKNMAIQSANLVGNSTGQNDMVSSKY